MSVYELRRTCHGEFHIFQGLVKLNNFKYYLNIRRIDNDLVKNKRIYAI